MQEYKFGMLGQLQIFVYRVLASMEHKRAFLGILLSVKQEPFYMRTASNRAANLTR